MPSKKNINKIFIDETTSKDFCLKGCRENCGCQKYILVGVGCIIIPSSYYSDLEERYSNFKIDAIRRFSFTNEHGDRILEEGFHFTEDPDEIRKDFLLFIKENINNCKYHFRYTIIKSDTKYDARKLYSILHTSLIKQICVRYQKKYLKFYFETYDGLNNKYEKIIQYSIDKLKQNKSFKVPKIQGNACIINKGDSNSYPLEFVDYFMQILSRFITLGLESQDSKNINHTIKITKYTYDRFSDNLTTKSYQVRDILSIQSNISSSICVKIHPDIFR